MRESEFRNKVVVVSGAAQGIGNAVAKALLGEGAIVVGLDVQYKNAVPVLPTATGWHEIGLDITDADAVTHHIKKIEEEIGPIEYLVNVAGILRMGKLLELSTQDWEDTLAVNVTGPFNLCKAVAKYMIGRKGGSIVAVGSNAAGIPRMGMGGYAASKAALTLMVKSLGLELAAYNIRCNVVAPGSTDTQMQRQLWVDETGPKKVIEGSLDQFRLGVPLRRIAQPSQIADLVLFLLSNRASHITMENILIDGGATLGC